MDFTIYPDEKGRAVITLIKEGNTPGKTITLWGNHIDLLFSPKVSKWLRDYAETRIRLNPSERDAEFAFRVSEREWKEQEEKQRSEDGS
jgi:hypothetical protein